MMLAAAASVLASWSLWALEWDDRRALTWLALGLSALFAIGELVPVSIEFRREVHTFSFTSVPFVVGLFYLPAQSLVLSRLTASVFVLAVVHRQPLYRLVTNLATHLVEVVVAVGITQLLTSHLTPGPSGWLVITCAVVTADLAGAALVTAAISVYQQKFEPSLLSGLWLGGISIVVDLLLALVIVALARTGQTEIWLMVPVVLFILLVLRQFSAINSRHQHVQLLYRLNSALSAAVVEGDVIPPLLSESVDILHADAAWLVHCDSTGEAWRTHLDESGRIATTAATDVDTAILSRLRTDPTAILLTADDIEALGLDGAGHNEVIAAPLMVDAATLMVLAIADRSGNLRSFDDDDVTLVSTLAVHAAVVLRNANLVESLRAESDRNEDLAMHDFLTGLPNRTLIHAELTSSLQRGEPLAVMLIDLDRFKEVNDTLGHQSGDLLLVEAGARMQAMVGSGDIIARLGGDEFGVLVRSVTGTRDLMAFGDRLREVLCETYSLADAEVEIGASIGISIASDATHDAATMLRQADVAMYAAKQDHLGVELYTEARDNHSRERLAMVSQLRSAIDDHQLEMYYQPLVDLPTGAVIGAEALVRWRKPDGSMVAPDDFISVAENTGLIRPLTQFVLRDCIAQAVRWRDRGLDLRLSLNLSPRNLLEADLAAQITDMLRTARLDPSRLQLELTESTVMSDPARTIGILRRLRATGVGLAIDDFGTGHSSLAYLTNLPATELKIDKSFVSAMETDPASRTVVRSIIDLGRNLGLEVLAEGIETAHQLESLREMGCHLGQGYLFSRPVPVDEFDRQVDSWTAAAHAT